MIFPHEMTSEERAQKFILIMYHNPDLDSAPDWMHNVAI